MSSPKITFYYQRDFGSKMSTTVDFIKENFKKLFWALLLIGGPVAIVVSLVFRDMFDNMFSFMDFDDPSMMGSFFGRLGLDYLIMMLLTWTATLMITSITYKFMIKYNNNDLDDLSLGDLFSSALNKIPGLLLLSFLVTIVTVLGSFLFIIPGIYLAIVFTLSYPVYMFEDVSVGEAFSRPFTLVKGKWWSTFGVMVIGYLMAYVVQLVFSVPFLIIYFINIFTMIQETPDDPSSFLNMFSSGYTTVAMAFQYIGQFISLAIPMIALAYQYANLVERSEGKGLLQEIDGFDRTN